MRKKVVSITDNPCGLKLFTCEDGTKNLFNLFHIYHIEDCGDGCAIKIDPSLCRHLLYEYEIGWMTTAEMKKIVLRSVSDRAKASAKEFLKTLKNG